MDAVAFFFYFAFYYLLVLAILQVPDGQFEVRGLVGEQAGEGVVPGNNGGDDTEIATGLADGRVDESAEGEEQECHRQEEEECHQTAGGTESGKEQDKREDGPADEIDAQSIIKGCLIGASLVRSQDAERRNEDDAKGQPEATIWGEGGGTEGVPCPELPHTSQELYKAAVEQGETNDDVGDFECRGAGIVNGEDEGRQSETAETQGTGVPNFYRRGGVGQFL